MVTSSGMGHVLDYTGYYGRPMEQDRQTIIFLPCGFYLLSFFLLFFLANLSDRRLDVYHTSTHGVAPVRIQNAGPKCAACGSLEMQDPKNRQNFAVCAPPHKFVELYLRNKGMYRESEKNLLNRNISSRCPHNMANFDPLTAEIISGVRGSPANFNGFHVLPSLLQQRRSPEANQTLHDVWLSSGLVHYIYIGIYIFGALAPKGIFTLCPSLAISYIGSVTARHCSSGHKPDFAAWYKEWNQGTSAEGNTLCQRLQHGKTTAGRPSRWALAHISSYNWIVIVPLVKKNSRIN